MTITHRRRGRAYGFYAYVLQAPFPQGALL